MRKQDRFQTTVHQKKTNTDLYIHWEAEAPKTWKRSTLRGLIRTAFNICSNEELLKQEPDHLQRSFHDIKNSSLLKHSLETGHDTIKVEDTSILASKFGDYKTKKNR